MKKTELKNARLPVPHLFAYGLDADCHKVGTEESGFTYEAGIPSMYSSRTGKRVCRGDINGIGRAATQSKWFNQLGGYYTFSQEVSDAIGGYPEGAILYYKDNTTGRLRTVRSLIPDNAYNFADDPSLINDEYWSYVDNVQPSGFRPMIFQDFVNNPKSGILRVDQTVTVTYPCVFMIQTGCDNMDTTGDDADFIMHATVRREGETEFYTAGLVCYLPALASVVASGIISDPRYDAAAKTMGSAYHAYNSPSPIQLYLLPGDTVKLTGNREFEAIQSEEYKYWIIPLHA